MKKAIAAIVIVTLLVAGFTAAKLFIIGEPVDGNCLAVTAEAHDGQLDIYMQVTDSAMAISNLQYRYEGTILYITPWKVLSSPLNSDGDKFLYYELTDETEVWVGGRLIWKAE